MLKLLCVAAGLFLGLQCMPMRVMSRFLLRRSVEALKEGEKARRDGYDRPRGSGCSAARAVCRPKRVEVKVAPLIPSSQLLVSSEEIKL
jgi:hypothetical protein